MVDGNELEQLRALIARQQAQLDQLQQHLQQVHQDQARQASPVIVDTRVMEKIPIFDGNEAHFAEWRFSLFSQLASWVAMLEHNSGSHAVFVTQSWLSSSLDSQGKHLLFVSSFGILR